MACFPPAFSAAKLVSLLSVDENSAVSETLNNLVENLKPAYVNIKNHLQSLTPIDHSFHIPKKTSLHSLQLPQLAYEEENKTTQYHSSSQQKQKTVLYTQGTENFRSCQHIGCFVTFQGTVLPTDIIVNKISQCDESLPHFLRQTHAHHQAF